MHCREFEEHLEPMLLGQFDTQTAARFEAHRVDCARCAGLLDLVRGGGDGLETPDGEAFVASLLEQTVGSACSRAETQLCDWVDGALHNADAELMAMHVDHCDGCAALAASLHVLALELPAMAEVDPGPAFAPAIVRRLRVETARVAMTWPERLYATWQELLLRPRAALELATAGCFVLLLMCGLPFSPMRDVPRQALSVAQINPVAATMTSAQRLEPVWEAYGAPAWDKTGGWLVDRGRNFGSEFIERRPRAAEAWTSMQTNLSNVGGGLAGHDAEQLQQAVRALADDVESFWDGLWNAEPVEDLAPPQPSEE